MRDQADQVYLGVWPHDHQAEVTDQLVFSKRKGPSTN